MLRLEPTAHQLLHGSLWGTLIRGDSPAHLLRKRRPGTNHRRVIGPHLGTRQGLPLGISNSGGRVTALVHLALVELEQRREIPCPASDRIHASSILERFELAFADRSLAQVAIMDLLD